MQLPLRAQSAPAIPQKIWDEMARRGPIWGQSVAANVKCMVDLYSAVLATAPKSGVSRTSDVQYGPHARNVLDIYVGEGSHELASGASKRKPALLFLHGGAFVEGEKNKSEEVYANVMYFFARHGVVGINIEYRLAPEATYPDGNTDVQMAVKWVHDHASELGIDKTRVFLMGHSAGAAHAAGYAYDTKTHRVDGSGLAGLIVVSGRVRADCSAENPNAGKVKSYYGADDQTYDAKSPVSFVNADSVSTLIAVAEYENPLIDVYCAELAYKLALAKRKLVPFFWIPKHNHTSIIAHFNTAEDFLPKVILQFINDPANCRT